MHPKFQSVLSLVLLLGSTLPASAAVVPVTRADDLDFQGNFVLALTTRADAAGLQVGDAVFNVDPDGLPGEISGFNNIEGWGNVFYSGSTNATDDTNLSQVMNSIEWSQANVNPLLSVNITGLTQGSSYKLQLLFQEGCCGDRWTDITLDGALIEDEMHYPAPGTIGQAVVQEFVAAGTSALVEFPYATAGADHNATIGAVTVEALIPEPASFALLSVAALTLLGRRRR